LIQCNWGGVDGFVNIKCLDVVYICAGKTYQA